MNEVERYLKRATRGLWGQKKRDAQAELRGAVDDKVYRHRLLGMDEAGATAAALRDLGSPAAIARALGEVHTAPQALKVLALVGVAGVLGLQAAAQVPVVRATLDPQMTTSCVYDDSILGQMSAEMAADLRRQLAAPGGREKIQADCLAHLPVPAPSLLRLSDVVAALRAGGVGVTPVVGADSLFHLSFPGESPNQLLSLDYIVRHIDGVDYVDGMFLVDRLRTSVTVPIRVSGLRNPVVSIGPAQLQLGTAETPVLATNLYITALIDRLAPELPRMKSGPYPAVSFSPDSLSDPDQTHWLRVSDQDGTVYGLLSNADLVRPDCQCADAERERLYNLSVRALQGGLLPAPLTDRQDTAPPRLVGSLPQLLQATVKGQRALLVYRLDAADLRQLTPTPVPVSQLKTESP